ncbi:MAG: hypothetical protein IJP13_01930 [Lachnospiraceae bacterium]|nr:hypothetical protein [Lachnospiraceae bacterium]
MKIHITNLYNFNKDDELVKRQHHFADEGRELGFYEMGIFSYPVESDSESELSKRLDGIIAALEAEDLVFFQLPTRNGYNYDSRLVGKIRAYRGKIALIIHDMKLIGGSESASRQYIELCKNADVVLVPSLKDMNLLKKYGVKQLISYEKIQQGAWYYKKVLLDAVDKADFVDTSIENATNTYEDEIHIGFGLYDKTGNYSVYVGTVMQSIVENTVASVCFHILHDETLNDSNRKKLSYVAESTGHRICFHLINNKMFESVANQMRHFTIGTMFRILLPDILSDVDRIIYLDADLLVNRDIKELWDMDISQYYMAAVGDSAIAEMLTKPVPVMMKQVEEDKYFNAGVLYINLKQIRNKGDMKTEVLDYLIKNENVQYPDQDALNVIYKDKILLLDSSWNYFAKYARNNNERELEPRIYHYAGSFYALYYQTAMDNLYYETVSRTPWGLEEGRKLLNKSIGRICDRSSYLEKLLRALAEGNKKKIYYGNEDIAMRNFYSMMSINKQDYRIMDEHSEKTSGILEGKPFEELEKEQDEYVVFVHPGTDGGRAMEKLDKLGLKNGEDYFNILQLLMPHLGGYL